MTGPLTAEDSLRLHQCLSLGDEAPQVSAVHGDRALRAVPAGAAFALLDALSAAQTAGKIAEEANELVLGFHRVWRELEAALEEVEERPPGI